MATQLVLQLMLVLVWIQEASAQESSIAKHGCPEKCGLVDIPYPFGIGTNCSADVRLEIDCHSGYNPPKPFLYWNNLEVLKISVTEGTVEVNNPVFKDCSTNGSEIQQTIYLYRPYTYSVTRNRFTAMGCNNLAFMTKIGSNVGGCMSFCNSTGEDNSCYGINCCQSTIPPYLWNFSTSLTTINPSTDTRGCKYAFIADQSWFMNLPNIYNVRESKQVPAVLNWKLEDFCFSFGSSTNETRHNSSVCGINTECTNQSLCACKEGYEGNPYLPHGCQDIDECAINQHDCQQICHNLPGNYTCSCKHGYEAFGSYRCMVAANVKKASIILAIATCGGLGVLLLLAGTWWLRKVIKGRKIRKLKAKNFERNGGLLLHQQVSSSEGNVDTTKLFTSKELEMATDHYNKDRILGQGGQGTTTRKNRSHNGLYPSSEAFLFRCLLECRLLRVSDDSSITVVYVAERQHK